MLWRPTGQMAGYMVVGRCIAKHHIDMVICHCLRLTLPQRLSRPRPCVGRTTSHILLHRCVCLRGAAVTQNRVLPPPKQTRVGMLRALSPIHPTHPATGITTQRILDPSRPALITSIRNIWRLWAYINLAGISGNTTKKCIHELYNYIYWEATA
jgi:hypothetical protein